MKNESEPAPVLRHPRWFSVAAIPAAAAALLLGFSFFGPHGDSSSNWEEETVDAPEFKPFFDDSKEGDVRHRRSQDSIRHLDSDARAKQLLSGDGEAVTDEESANIRGRNESADPASESFFKAPESLHKHALEEREIEVRREVFNKNLDQGTLLPAAETLSKELLLRARSLETNGEARGKLSQFDQEKKNASDGKEGPDSFLRYDARENLVQNENLAADRVDALQDSFGITGEADKGVRGAGRKGFRGGSARKKPASQDSPTETPQPGQKPSATYKGPGDNPPPSAGPSSKSATVDGRRAPTGQSAPSLGLADAPGAPATPRAAVAPPKSSQPGVDADSLRFLGRDLKARDQQPAHLNSLYVTVDPSPKRVPLGDSGVVDNLGQVVLGTQPQTQANQDMAGYLAGEQGGAVLNELSKSVLKIQNQPQSVKVGKAQTPKQQAGVHVYDYSAPATAAPTIGGGGAAPAKSGRIAFAATPEAQRGLLADGDGDEISALEELGYVGVVDEEAVELQVRFGEDFGDSSGSVRNSLGELNDLVTTFGWQPAPLEVHDGYGRCYRGPQIVHHIRPVHPKESPRDMFFRYYGDHAFVHSNKDALSTFSVDVDTASYPLTRNYLVNNHLPPKSAVRTEEFVNYFNHDLQPPSEGDFAIHLEYLQSRFGHAENVGLLRVGIKAREVSRKDRKPMRLTFVVDSSGSMADGNRIELVKRALELLVDQLEAEDEVGIITFNSSARTVLEPTPAYDRWQIREAVRGLSTGGSTNAEAGLIMGYRMAENNYAEGSINRVILCSDGVANTGETDQARILEQIRSFSERQIDLTSIGVGMGNHNDVFLEQMADKGNGSCHYVDDFEEAKRVFVEQFTGTLQTVARDVKIQVEFDTGSVIRWRQLGYENRSLAHRDFRNDAVDAGEVGAGHEVVALYEVEENPATAVALEAAGPEGALATVRLRWIPDGQSEAIEMERRIALGAKLSRWQLAPARLRMAAVVAQYAEVLRRSYWARGDSYERLQQEAVQLAQELNGDRRVVELRDMVNRSKQLIAQLPPQDELAQIVEEARRRRLQQAELEQIEARSSELESLLQELRKQNDELEKRVQEVLQKGR